MIKQLVILISALLLVTCSVQKRKYQKGYSVQWKHFSKQDERKNKNALVVSNQESNVRINQPKEQVSASAANKLEDIKLPKLKIYEPSPDSCDVILFRDGSEKKVKVIEIASTQIKYKNCDMPDGPLFISNKADVFMITYVTGLKEVFKVEPRSSPSPTQQTNYNAYKEHKERSQKKRTAMATSAFIFSMVGIYPLLFISSIVAVILSTIQLNRIQMDPDHYGGERKAKIAQITGIVGTIIGVLLVALIVLGL